MSRRPQMKSTSRTESLKQVFYLSFCLVMLLALLVFERAEKQTSDREVSPQDPLAHTITREIEKLRNNHKRIN